MSYLLALQLVCRDLPVKRIRRVRRLLEPNQAAYLGRFVSELRPRREEILLRLGIGPSAAGHPDLEQPLVRPLSDQELKVTIFGGEPERIPSPLPNAGQPVFRVREGTRLYGSVVLHAIAGGVLGAVVATLIDHAVVGVAGVVGGCLVAILRRDHLPDVCSAPGCGELFPRGAESCARCGGIVAGRASSRRQHYSAEENYRRGTRIG